MSRPIAALPMYDWPETRDEVDASWTAIRDRLRAAGVDAPDKLVRRNADLPPVPGGIRDAAGTVIAPDPATLPPDEFDFRTLWRHPQLLLAQTCWGPMEETGLLAHVETVGQPDYSGVGGVGADYRSVVVMHAASGTRSRTTPMNGGAMLPVDAFRSRRLAYNEPHSMSGMIALRRDLEANGESLDIFSERIETGGHRLSIRAIAEGRADVATIDCRSWALAKRFEPAAREVRIVGWTALRPGLPYITARGMPLEALRAALG